MRTFSPLLLIIFLCLSIKSSSSKPYQKSNHEKTRELISTLEKFLNLYYDTHSQKIEDFEKKHEHKHSRKHFNRNVKFLNTEEIEEPLYFESEHKSKTKHAKIKDYEESDNIYDRMQGDQPMEENEESSNSGQRIGNMENVDNAELEALRAKERERIRKLNWTEYLKQQILRTLGRENFTSSHTTPTTEDPTLSSISISDIMPAILNTTNYADDDQITEKIRSFYPSCETPGTDMEVWKDEDIMNLHFEIDYLSGSSNSNIATATLRLYRLPQNGTTKSATDTDNNCGENNESTEEEKLLRVTVYWFTKSQKKRRGKHVVDIKRRLSDSRVVSEKARWVELSVKPATQVWTTINPKNLGLGVLVEDQEGKALRADKYFKGAACTVGMSTPKPIPTIIKDVAIGQSNELDRIHNLLGGDSNSTLHSDIQLLPSVDICFLEFPDKFDASHFDPKRINACNLRKAHEESQRQVERELQERLASISEYIRPVSRHIRHQSHHLANKMAAEEGQNGGGASGLGFDIRSRITNSKIIMTKEELDNLTQDKNKFVHR